MGATICSWTSAEIVEAMFPENAERRRDPACWTAWQTVSTRLSHGAYVLGGPRFRVSVLLGSGLRSRRQALSKSNIDNEKNAARHTSSKAWAIIKKTTDP